MLISIATLGVVPSPFALTPHRGAIKGRYNVPRSFGSRSRYYALLNQRVVTVIVGFAPRLPFRIHPSLLRPAPCARHPSIPCFTVANPWVREGETSHRRRRARRVPMNFINKTTSTEMCAALTRPDKAQTDRPVQLLLYVSPRD